ncbi:hypothetical protein LK996_16420 [Lysobacter sp. A6]|uniref:DUF6868 domain-containing protein n=1 Tax=Noviluteimonas lactosilytica TaxID=2888523 RepID=A0ABS8JM75_9GAMM|nr:hypothetical protein [Lysobacter lactosilyticus]MCC8364657.1 hypothetical protein [Lysobacter lactosilyticus]
MHVAESANLVPFLLWCALANYTILLVVFMAFVWLRGWMRRMHQRWFALTDAQIDGYMYAFLGFYKLAVWFFLLIPALVLLAMR